MRQGASNVCAVRPAEGAWVITLGQPATVVYITTGSNPDTWPSDALHNPMVPA